jgi:hypothetical protein
MMNLMEMDNMFGKQGIFTKDHGSKVKNMV